MSTAGGDNIARPAAGESDACDRGSNTSGRASPWPWQNTSTAPQRESYCAPRGQKPPPPGTRPGLLMEPEPPLAAVRAASPRTELPSLATPCLADATADEVDASALRHILAARISQLSAVKERKRKEEEKAKELTDSAYSMLEKAGGRKRKEKRMKRFLVVLSYLHLFHEPFVSGSLVLRVNGFMYMRQSRRSSRCSHLFSGLYSMSPRLWQFVRSLGRLRSTSIWMFLRVTSGSVSVFCPACFDRGYMYMRQKRTCPLTQVVTFVSVHPKSTGKLDCSGR